MRSISLLAGVDPRSRYLGANCNPSPHHGWAAWRFGARPALAAEYARAMRLGLYMHEQLLPPSLPWGELAVGVVLRDPLHRLLSHALEIKCAPRETERVCFSRALLSRALLSSALLR